MAICDLGATKQKGKVKSIMETSARISLNHSTNPGNRLPLDSLKINPSSVLLNLAAH